MAGWRRKQKEGAGTPGEIVWRDRWRDETAARDDHIVVSTAVKCVMIYVIVNRLSSSYCLFTLIGIPREERGRTRGASERAERAAGERGEAERGAPGLALGN